MAYPVIDNHTVFCKFGRWKGDIDDLYYRYNTMLPSLQIMLFQTNESVAAEKRILVRHASSRIDRRKTSENFHMADERTRASYIASFEQITSSACAVHPRSVVTTIEQKYELFTTIEAQIDVAAGELLINSGPMRSLDVGTWRSHSNLIGLAKENGGSVSVAYYRACDGFGRLTCAYLADGIGPLPNFLSLMREVRAHLSAPYYWDVDMVNSAPTLLLQTLQRHNIESPLLARYVEHRAACIKELGDACGVNRDTAKELFIRMLFFGTVEAWVYDSNVDPATVPQWLCAFQTELRQCGETLLARPEQRSLRERSCKEPAKRLAHMMAIFMQTRERWCLEALVEAAKAGGRELGALIHDGMHVCRRETDGPAGVPDEELRGWESAILEATGFAVRLAVKPFECNPAWLGVPKPPTEEMWDDDWMAGGSLMPYGEMKRRWEMRSFKVTDTGEFVRQERHRDNIWSRQRLLDSWEHLSYSVVTKAEDGKTTVSKRPFVAEWLRDPTIRSFARMNLYPPPLRCPPEEYNTWNDFEVARYQPTKPVDTDSDGVRAIIGHVRMLMKYNEAWSNCMLDWISQIFQQPALKSRILVLLKGQEGCGKNRLTDLLQLMTGVDKYLETSSPETTLYGEFTEPRKNKFLVVMNEANGRDNFKSADKLKDMITSSTFVCNGKHRASYSMNCYARFLLTTNGLNCLKVESQSRRFWLFEVSSEKKGDSPYFHELSRHIADPHTRYEFFKCLMQRDLSQVDWNTYKPETPFHQAAIELNLDFEFMYLRDAVLLPAYRAIESTRGATPGVRMGAADLFNSFREWLSRTGMKKHCEPTEARFGTKLRELMEGEASMPGVQKRRTKRGFQYEFDVDVVLAEMLARRWMRPEDRYRADEVDTDGASSNNDDDPLDPLR